MIRFSCPECDRKLSVNDARAGQVGICPQCKSKFEIPEPEMELEIIEEPEPPPKKSAAIREDEPPSRALPKKRRFDPDARSSDEDFDDDDDDRDRTPVRRRKKKRRRSDAGLIMGMDGFVVALLGLGGFALFTVVLALVVPAIIIIPLILGYITILVGGIWYIIAVFQESSLSGLLCFVVPFYSLYYLITHFEEVKRPFFVQLTGVMILMLCIPVAALTASTRPRPAELDFEFGQRTVVGRYA